MKTNIIHGCGYGSIEEIFRVAIIPSFISPTEIMLNDMSNDTGKSHVARTPSFEAIFESVILHILIASVVLGLQLERYSADGILLNMKLLPFDTDQLDEPSQP